MKKKLRIGVIFGGQSGEHEVSLVSGESVIKALNKSKYEVIPIGITKEGKWLTSGNPLEILKAGRFKELKTDSIIIPDPTKKYLIQISNKYFATHIKNPNNINLIIPMLHGTYGEDGTIQGLLELANIPYVGANVLGSAIGMDKIIQKQLFREVGLPVIDFLYFSSTDLKKSRKTIFSKIKKLGYPVFVKPANLGSSVGISKVFDQNKLLSSINHALQYDRKIIIEKALIKPREIEMAVLGNDAPETSVPGEIVASNEFYDYDAKYVDDLSKTIIPAPLPKKISEQIKEMAVKAFKTIDCSGMARVDFLVTKNNKIYISELNTIPGFTSISMYPKLWQASGLTYPKLLDKLIFLAIERHKEKSKLIRSYKPKEKWYT